MKAALIALAVLMSVGVMVPAGLSGPSSPLDLSGPAPVALPQKQLAGSTGHSPEPVALRQAQRYVHRHWQAPAQPAALGATTSAAATPSTTAAPAPAAATATPATPAASSSSSTPSSWTPAKRHAAAQSAVATKCARAEITAATCARDGFTYG